MAETSHRGKAPLFGVTPTPRERDLACSQIEWQVHLAALRVGAFSYADVMGCFDIGSEDEALHCIYQTSDADRCRQLFDKWLQKVRKDPSAN